MKCILFSVLMVYSSIIYSSELGLSQENIDRFVSRIYLTGMLYGTTDNEMVIHDSDRDDLTSSNNEGFVEIGTLLSYRYHNVAFKGLLNSNDIIDYAFLSITVFNDERYGLRLGRVNRLSGFFGGFGPHSDRMNFLPSGSSPLRFVDTFYRFDGIQWFGSIGKTTTMHWDITFGEPLVGDKTGLFDPTFFAIFSKKEFDVKSNRTTLFTNITVTHDDWQFFVDYISGNISFDALFETTLKYSDIESSSEYDFEFEYSTKVHVPDYEIRVLKTGISKSFDVSEMLITFFEQYGRMPQDNKFTIGGQTLGRKFKPMGASIMWRTYIGYTDLLYLGFSKYKIDLNSETLSQFGVYVPKHGDRQDNWFIGYSKRFTDNLYGIAEVHYNEGTATLSATYQDPSNSSKYWWAYSGSLSLVF